VLPFDLNLRMDMYGIVTRRQHQLSPAAAAMLGALRETALLARPAPRDVFDHLMAKL
jgi:hypothetical protein